QRGAIGLRGAPPLSWEETRAPDRVVGDRHVFHLAIPPGEVVELKTVRDDDWAGGRNYALHAGDDLVLRPYFEREGCSIEGPHSLPCGEGELRYEVLLPPSYLEQETKRYPVIYALDGQSLWSTSADPYGVWGLETIVEGLYELDAMSEAIIVGIHTAERRLERLSPIADPKYGGGEGPEFLQAIIEGLMPRVCAEYRCRGGSEDTALLGSSMGGLFSFFAAWTRPDVFGKAACLSPSFWWSERYAVRLAGQGSCPAPRPLLYLDSGAPISAFERDVNARDSFPHMRSMFRALATHCYEPGVNLHYMLFPGQTHDAASWAARVAIPLQLLFPPTPGSPRHSPRTRSAG
ncbi:MAG: alpha/beta hydrolase-fold protein, partial [Polyangiaceae bacterium]|nr:alpha/beta hydrolase-fold protein [Polyangiaceae bacterium]